MYGFAISPQGDSDNNPRRVCHLQVGSQDNGEGITHTCTFVTSLNRLLLMAIMKVRACLWQEQSTCRLRGHCVWQEKAHSISPMQRASIKEILHLVFPAVGNEENFLHGKCVNGKG